MGSYGIGPGRVMAASVEQRHDETGLCWPFALAPYHVHVVVLPGVDEQVDVLLDDRDLRAGEKFADADLIGLPFRVTVGKKTLEDGKVDLRDRETGADRRVGVTELSKEVLNGKTS